MPKPRREHRPKVFPFSLPAREFFKNRTLCCHNPSEQQSFYLVTKVLNGLKERTPSPVLDQGKSNKVLGSRKMERRKGFPLSSASLLCFQERLLGQDVWKGKIDHPNLFSSRCLLHAPILICNASSAPIIFTKSQWEKSKRLWVFGNWFLLLLSLNGAVI